MTTALPDHRLDLHRMTVAQAVVALERHLQQADTAHLPYVRIVHGHGAGALRDAVAGHLAGHRLVACHYAAGPAEGGYGVTIAELKSGQRRRIPAAEAQRLAAPVPLKRK